MKNLKIILLVLIGILLIGSLGCGGGGGSSNSEGTSEPQNEQNEQQEERDEAVANFIEKILTPGSDGAPQIFDYAPKPESSDEDAAVDLQEVQFVKYISSKDLNTDGEYLQTIRLNKDSEYVIKYSHGGRSLNNAFLNLKISAPDKNEMILDLASKPVSGDGNYYVPTDLEVIPDESPCIIMYRFKAPLTGDYKFAISESKPYSDDIPFEFRIYGSEESYSAADNEEFELTPRQILDIQRILLSQATELNENGLPVFNTGEEELNSSALDTASAPRIEIPDIIIPNAKQTQTEVIPDPVINNVPYDKIFEEGAGFYAHSGLRGITNVIDDEAFSPNAIRKFTMPTPGTGSANNTKENFSVNVIATMEEHNRALDFAGISNFALLRDALGYTDRQDYARLGSDHTIIISVRYEIIEDKPRIPDPKIFRLYDEAMEELKEYGSDYFTSEYGDYFVAGYTWGTRYEATIEIIQLDSANFMNLYDPEAMNALTSLLNLTVKNAGSTSSNIEAQKNSYLAKLQSDNHTNIRVIHSRCTGRSSDMSFSIPDFVRDLENFVKSAKQTPRSQYEKLYVTLRRYREIEDVKPYIPEKLKISKSLYDDIRKLNEKILETRCYYNALMSLPASHLMDGSALQSQWRNEFETELVTRMRGSVNYICADRGRVNEYYNKFDALFQKYKALAERYNFYRYFIWETGDFMGQSPSWNTSTERLNVTHCRGFRTYDRSTIVLKDMQAGRYKEEEHSEEWYEGDGEKDFSGSFSDEYIYRFDTGYRKTNYCTGHDVNGKTIGRKSYHWHYTGASSRRLEVFLHLWTVKMPSNLYPFAGL